MACLAKISAGLNWTCIGGSDANIARITEAILINHSDIVSAASGVPVLAVGTKGYPCNSINNSIRASVELNAVEGGRNAVRVSITINTDGVTGLDGGGSLSPVLGGRYAVAFVSTAGTYMIAGVVGALEVTELTASSTDNNGIVSFTLATPDWQIGSSYRNLTKAEYEALKVTKE